MQQADRQARMQNAQFGSNILSSRLGQIGAAQQGRQQLFVDPQNVLRSSGVGLSGGQLFGGLAGLQGSIGSANQQAAFSEQAANQKQGFGRSLLQGVAGGAASGFGKSLGGGFNFDFFGSKK